MIHQQIYIIKIYIYSISILCIVLYTSTRRWYNRICVSQWCQLSGVPAGNALINRSIDIYILDIYIYVFNTIRFVRSYLFGTIGPWYIFTSRYAFVIRDTIV